MKSVEDYMQKLRCSWLAFDQKCLVKAVRDPKITEEEALKKMKAYSESQGIFSRWMHEAVVGKDKLRQHLLQTMERMRILELHKPEPDEAVQKFLDGGDLPKE
ncbi:MAG TPA: hypothetical protein VK254_03060 [Candidatus Bathyarchaeia archaeon]|nr:hypothetical protein [Candidatus Bathyarchaeia archaeon]